MAEQRPNVAVVVDPLGQLRRRSWWALGISLLFFVGVVSAVGFLIRPSYVAIVPGSARDTGAALTIEGAEVFPSEGALLYTTIRLRDDMDLWSYLWTKLDGNSQFIERQAYFGSLTPAEDRAIKLASMTSAKDTAIAVALNELGYQTVRDAGVLVAQVISGSPADGILELGDVFNTMDGEPVTSDVQLIDLLGDYRPGDVVSFDVMRAEDGRHEEVKIELAEHPDRPGVGFIGISPATVADISEPPFTITIESGTVGGPSAGLAFTLTLLDELTPGELTGGAQVAVTGTIGIDGRVGPIGGIVQKAVAVRKAGASMFIVPAAQSPEELALVRERVGEGIQVVEVENLRQALDALASIGGDVDAIAEFALGQGTP